jgi:hypothetical protein
MSRFRELQRVQVGAQNELRRLMLRDLGFTLTVRPEHWVERNPDAVSEECEDTARRLIEAEKKLDAIRGYCPRCQRAS